MGSVLKLGNVPKMVRDTFLVKVLKFDEKQNEEREFRNWKWKLESSKKWKLGFSLGRLRTKWALQPLPALESVASTLRKPQVARECLLLSLLLGTIGCLSQDILST